MALADIVAASCISSATSDEICAIPDSWLVEVVAPLLKAKRSSVDTDDPFLRSCCACSILSRTIRKNFSESFWSDLRSFRNWVWISWFPPSRIVVASFSACSKTRSEEVNRKRWINSSVAPRRFRKFWMWRRRSFLSLKWCFWRELCSAVEK